MTHTTHRSMIMNKTHTKYSIITVWNQQIQMYDDHSKLTPLDYMVMVLNSPSNFIKHPLLNTPFQPWK